MPKHDLDKYTELTDVNFDFEGAHIAVVHKKQGGAANGVHSALITKATNEISEEDLDEIIQKDFSRAKVSMRLDDFLEYFKELSEEEQEESFYHYEQRAEGRVPVLNETFFEDRINDMDFLKSMSLEEISNLTEEQKLKVKLFQSDFEKGLLSGNSPEGEVEDDPKGSISKSEETQKTGEKETMSEKDNKNEVDMEKALSESPVVKAMKEELDLLKAQKAQAEEQALVKSVSAFEFVEEDKAEALAKALHSMDSEKQDEVLDALSKANTKIKDLEKNADMYVQKSVSGEGDFAPEESLAEKVSKAVKGE